MKNIVTVGGGTGSYTILSGLKNLDGINITAIVSMADDGGSNKIMRDELGVLPPSDTRLCLVALSEHTDIVRKLMLYRFSEGTLAGNTFGNLFLAALEKVTGDFGKGVEVASEILKVKGTVVPVTRVKAELAVRLKNGTVLAGEHSIDEADLESVGVEEIFYQSNVPLNEKAAVAIQNADYIVAGPGDFYTSIVPNLIAQGFREAVAGTRAKIILPLNLTNKQGHNMGWSASDYVNNLERYLGRKVDFILINTEAPSQEQIEQYAQEERGDVLIKDDLVHDPRVVRAPLLSHLMYENSKGDVMKRSFIRHDSEKLAQALKNIIK